MASFLDLELIMDTNISRCNAVSSYEFESTVPHLSSENEVLESLPNVQTKELVGALGAATHEEAEAQRLSRMHYSSTVANSSAGIATLSLALNSFCYLNDNAITRAVPPTRALRLGFAPSSPKKVAAKSKPKSAARQEDTSARTALNPSPVVGSAKSIAEASNSQVDQRKNASKAGSFISPFPEFQRALGPYLGEPRNPAALRRATIVWFRNDLRVHDNEALVKASNDSLSMLPVYCFDPRDYGKSSSGFDKTGPYRAKFLLECVANLRASLRERGSELVVRVGKPEEVLRTLAKSVGADACYAHKEVTHEEMNAEDNVSAALKEEGVEPKFFWGSTLFHVEDLPFKLEDMPSNYGGFREKVQGVKVRSTIPAPKQLKGVPIRGSVKAGDMPSLQELGLNQSSTMRPEKHTAHGGASLVGGELEALERLKSFSTEASGLFSKNGGAKKTGESIYGANFSCKISPWLALGCLSPRRMFEDLRQSTNRTIAASSDTQKGINPGDDGMNWLIFELLWRDFFRFITKKFGDGKRLNGHAPITACTGSLATA